jgi:periplasmic copper chaperone A
VFFRDAQIVWKGKAAYSANETTKAQIAAETDVAELPSLKTGDEIWVRY